MGGCGPEYLLHYEIPCPTTDDATVIHNSWGTGTYMTYGVGPSNSRELIMNQLGTDVHGDSLQDLGSEAGNMEPVPAGARVTVHGTLQFDLDTPKGRSTYYTDAGALPLGPPRTSFYQDPSPPSKNCNWPGPFAIGAHVGECRSLSPAADLGVDMLAGNVPSHIPFPTYNFEIQHEYQGKPPAYLYYHSQGISLYEPNTSVEPIAIYAGHDAGHPNTAYPPYP